MPNHGSNNKGSNDIPNLDLNLDLGSNQDQTKKKIPRGLVTKVENQVLDECAAAVEDNEDIIKTNRWDQSDVFYETRRRLDQMGYDVQFLSKGRRAITKHIKEYCENVLQVKRHEIGIFAADKAVMAFKGQLYSVSFENYSQLKETFSII